MRATWKPHEKQGRLTKRSDLPDSVFAYPAQRKEPMTNAAHVRNALARFDQVDGVSDAQRASAFANIKKAAAHYGVEVTEQDWKDLGRSPRRTNSEATRKKATRKKATRKKATRKKATRKKATRKKATRKKATRKKATRKKATRKKADARSR